LLPLLLTPASDADTAALGVSCTTCRTSCNAGQYVSDECGAVDAVHGQDATCKQCPAHSTLKPDTTRRNLFGSSGVQPPLIQDCACDAGYYGPACAGLCPGFVPRLGSALPERNVLPLNSIAGDALRLPLQNATLTLERRLVLQLTLRPDLLPVLHRHLLLALRPLPQLKARAALPRLASVRRRELGVEAQLTSGRQK
jgi:hypothetical protein